MRLLIGTDDGLFELTEATPNRLRTGTVSHLAVGWAIVDGRIERISGGDRSAGLELPDGLEPRCLMPVGEDLLIGTSRARLYRSRDGGEPEPVDGFDAAEGRDRWNTPWGGPPDTRSLARDADGTLYANVHVGGVLRSTDGEAWQPTMEIEADVHEVTAHPTLAGCVLVAAAWGLGLSFDGAGSWSFSSSGLHNAYARAVAVAGEVVLMSASDGPRGGRAALYRRPLRDDAPFERCTAGLPEWFTGNIDTGCLVVSGSAAAFGTADGEVYRSTDGGLTWSRAATGLPPIRALAAA
jgi:hypothetical protein